MFQKNWCPTFASLGQTQAYCGTPGKCYVKVMQRNTRRNKGECTRSGLRVALKDLPILRTRICCQNLTELKALYFS